MKKIYALLFTVFALHSFAQPVIDGKYLPVVGTAIKQIWDTTSNSLSIPQGGANMLWDYSNQFNQLPDTYKVATFLPGASPYGQYFPAATHATFATIPFNTIQDSCYTYFLIDHGGLHNLGGFNIKAGYDSTIITNPTELNLPFVYSYGSTDRDTSRNIAYLTSQGYQLRVIEWKYKWMDGIGYGTLKLPYSDFNNVLLIREKISTRDSIYVDFQGNGNYTLYNVQSGSNNTYRFLRNNTFGSSILMSMNTDTVDSWQYFGYYILPFECGSISGTVRDSGQAQTPVTNGTVLLYRENSNFSKDDILATAQVDANGYYQFDSIPYGQYRIAIRADQVQYPNAYTTYHGQVIDWLVATPVTTFNQPVVNNVDITLMYQVPGGAPGHLMGGLYLDYGYHAKVQAAQPIPGVDIIAKRNPGGVKTEIITDNNGQYDLSGLPDGNYDITVDIPGLLHHSYYANVAITNGNTASNLNFTVGEDSIYAGSNLVYINNHITTNSSAFAYPNPFNGSTTIRLTLNEKSNVTVEVLNLLGERVSLLDDKSTKAAGNYSYEFSGNQPSGIYFVKVNVNGTPNTFKIVKE